MKDSPSDIKTVVARVVTDKPVRKTPYQVKGVLMRQHPDEEIIPMLNGSYRDKYLYPRVQVKILNEQIYLIGIHEGAKPVIKLCESIQSLDFGNITFTVKDCDLETVNRQFIISNRLVRYKFITPWIALNHMTSGKYKFLKNKEKQSYLNKLLGQNIIFMAGEVGNNIREDIFTKVKVSSLFPKPIDENKWGSFKGEFKTNFVLPNYIGIGNGITRGFGTIYGLFNHESFSFDEGSLMVDESDNKIDTEDEMSELEKISFSDVPKPKRKKIIKTNNKQTKTKNNKKKRYKKHRKHDNSGAKKTRANSHSKSKNKKGSRYKNIFSEDYIIEDDGNKKNRNKTNENDDQRFNTEKHHKKQHKF
tara:strand:- start:364 stop:1446 length:1083 start_codon:yes stop_codon:yes gene_type:complete